MTSMADHLRPCSKCLRARQGVKNVVNAMSRRWQTNYILVQCVNGDITIRNSDKRVSAVSAANLEDLIDLEVYIGGKNVFDLQKAQRIAKLGPIVRMDGVD